MRGEIDIFKVRPPPAEMTDDDVTKHCEKLSIPTDGVPPADLRKTLEERTWSFRIGTVASVL